MPEFPAVTAQGEVQIGETVSPCAITVDESGVAVSVAGSAADHWPSYEIERVTRTDYELEVTRALGRGSTTLRRFARRTDELETALRRSRADALARLMAPPGDLPEEISEAAGVAPGFLYRYDDGVRWVPDTGDCFARLYGELNAVTFDAGDYSLRLAGPLGEDRVAGLQRLTREIEAEAARRIAEARTHFAGELANAGLPWGDDAAAGHVRRHVAFAPTETQLQQVDAAEGLICAERRDYWTRLRDAGKIARMVIGAGPEGSLRLVALCSVAQGELYEVLSEADHASFVFAAADDAVRAWTEVGFRREPIFMEEGADDYRILAEVLPSLRKARAGLTLRVIHDEPGAWWARLQ